MENAFLVHMLAQAQVRDILARAECDHRAPRAAIRVANRQSLIVFGLRSLVGRINNNHVAFGKVWLAQP